MKILFVLNVMLLFPEPIIILIDDNPVAQLFWGRCMIEKAAAFSYYNKGSRIRNLIHNLKYKGIKEIGFELGQNIWSIT